MKDSRVSCYKCKHNKYFEYSGYNCKHKNVAKECYDMVMGPYINYVDCCVARKDEDKCGASGKYFEPTFWAKLTRNNV